jgi:hypothetical protein
MNIVSTITHESDVQEFYIMAFDKKYEISIFPKGKSFEGDVVYSEGIDVFLVENKDPSPEVVLGKCIDEVMIKLKNEFVFDEDKHEISFVIDGACPHIKEDEAKTIVQSITQNAIVSKI